VTKVSPPNKGDNMVIYQGELGRGDEVEAGTEATPNTIHQTYQMAYVEGCWAGFISTGKPATMR